MKNRRIFWSAALLAGVVLLASCFKDATGPEQPGLDYRSEESFSINVPVDAQSQLELDNINGEISVVGEAELEMVAIEGLKIVKARSQADADEHLADIEIWQQLEDPEVVGIRTEHPSSGDDRQYEVEYEIRVPADWIIELAQSNGSIELSGLRGSADIALSNGTLSLADLIAELRASVANGAIDGRLALPPGGVCDIGLANGTVDVAIPTSTSAEFSAHVATGSISFTGLDFSDLVFEENLVTGVLGEGDGIIDIEVANGTIHVAGY